MILDLPHDIAVSALHLKLLYPLLCGNCEKRKMLCQKPDTAFFISMEGILFRKT